MTLGVIGRADVERTWPICSPLLEKAMRRGDKDYTMEDIKDGIKDGKYLLWAWEEGNRIICCAVTSFMFYPRKKICSVMMVGGSGLKLWKGPGIDTIADWAKKNGCSDMEGYVRKGWLRVLTNWRPLWTTVRRSL